VGLGPGAFFFTVYVQHVSAGAFRDGGLTTLTAFTDVLFTDQGDAIGLLRGNDRLATREYSVGGGRPGGKRGQPRPWVVHPSWLLFAITSHRDRAVGHSSQRLS